MSARRSPVSPASSIRSLLVLPLLSLLLIPGTLAAQSAVGAARGGGAGSEAPRLGRDLPAVRRETAVQVDGRLDEAAWARAEPASDFVQRRPDAGSPASQRSEARVLFDDGALYVGMRLFDTAPDSIAGALGRRDFSGFSDWAQVIIDSYHDRRSAFRFGVNPAGVKADAYLAGDDEWSQDSGWDAVWDAAATRDSAGWTAEMRIPLSQLRFSSAAGVGGSPRAWGIQFVRDLARRNERSLWAPSRPDEGGFVSRFGELHGMRVDPQRRLEAVPYLVGRVTRSPGEAGDPFHRPSRVLGSVGGDVRFGLSSDLTLTATLNPDFAQVEADPSQVNLTGSETYFAERRPFFLEGGDIFRSSMAEAPWIHGTEDLFYSRRIGRAPRGSAPADAAHAEQPELTTLLGAGKLSGKTSGGWSMGLLSAVTAEERARFVGPGGETGSAAVEPLTSYSVGRLMRDFRQGGSSLGVVLTSTQRSLDDGLDFLASSALVAGVDARHRFAAGDWELEGKLVGSRLQGSAEAIDRVARGPVHRQQRPDADHVDYDPARTSLSGTSATLRLHKLAGGHWRGGVAAHSVTPGFEANDLGFHTASDFRRAHVWVGYDQFRSGRHLNRWTGWLNTWSSWSFGDERIATGAELYANLTFPNYWDAWGSVRRELDAVDPNALRGGPALHRQARTSAMVGVATDRRRMIGLELSGNYSHGEDGARFLRTEPEVVLRPSGRMEVGLAPEVSWNRQPSQWVGAAGAGDSACYVVGALSQITAALTARLSYTFTPDLSLQVYGQPFVSGGRFGALREVADARARRPEDRFRTFAPDRLRPSPDRERLGVDADGDGASDFSIDNPDFNVKELNSNLVLRWEYRPGSTLFLVWSHGSSAEDGDGSFDLVRDSGRLMGLPSTHVVLLKWSHWIGK